MPEDKNKLSDSELFRRSIGEITPLADPNRVKPTQKPSPKPYSFSIISPIDQMVAAPEGGFTLVEGLETIKFSRPGVDKSLLKKLKKGQLEIEDVFDAHGLTSTKALQALAVFLAQQERSKHTVAMIVHGKGLGSDNKYPVLKNAFAQALRNHPSVLAFVSAAPREGGTGALYVLFKYL